MPELERIARNALLLLIGLPASACTGSEDVGNQYGDGFEDRFGNRQTVLWQLEEWSIQNGGWIGSPYDVVATVTFTHESVAEPPRTTGMYYDGGTTWRFRFTGVRQGTWSFTTSSSDAALDGHSGTVTVGPNPDPDAEGFLTHRDNRFAVQVGNDGELRGYVFNVFQDIVRHPPRALSTYDESRIDAYCGDARANGFGVLFFQVNNQWFSLDANRHDEHTREVPDPRTFSILENIIQHAMQQGCRVHLWAWGDEERRWTPIGIGGINGIPDRRVQRYLAARLGPIPGWTLGYGFDLSEWVAASEIDSWADYLRERLGWKHLLSARGHDLPGEHTIHGYPIEDAEIGDFGVPAAFPDHATIVDQLEARTDGPHLYEERHTWQRWGLDEDDTRRLAWRTVMAGGMGGWYGFFEEPRGYPESLQTALRTHYTFWHEGLRFNLDLVVDGAPGAMTLRMPDHSLVLAYVEDAGTIDLDLSGAPGPMQVAAVDTRASYREIDLGVLQPDSHVLDLPRRSDWVVEARTSPTAPGEAGTGAGGTHSDGR